MKLAIAVAVLLLTLCGSAFAQLDILGFCPPPATVSACTTATGLVEGGQQETIGVNGTSIGMEADANGSSNTPW